MSYSSNLKSNSGSNLITPSRGVDRPAQPDFQLKVEIEEDVYEKVMYWINKCSYEISGLGKVIYDEQRKCFKVIDAMLLKQENTSVTTEIDGAAISQAMYHLRDTPGSLNWWWHSHVNFDVFWSGTDLKAIESLASNGWFLNTVFNKKEEMRTCYYQTAPFSIFADNIQTSILQYVDEELAKEWDKEFDEKVVIKKPTPVVSKYPYSYPYTGNTVGKYTPPGHNNPYPKSSILTDEIPPYIPPNHRVGSIDSSLEDQYDFLPQVDFDDDEGDIEINLELISNSEFLQDYLTLWEDELIEMFEREYDFSSDEEELEEVEEVVKRSPKTALNEWDNKTSAKVKEKTSNVKEQKKEKTSYNIKSKHKIVSK